MKNREICSNDQVIKETKDRCACPPTVISTKLTNIMNGAIGGYNYSSLSDNDFLILKTWVSDLFSSYADSLPEDFHDSDNYELKASQNLLETRIPVPTKFFED